MYLTQMRSDQQEVLLAVLAGVMVADHVVRPEEKQVLHDRQVGNHMRLRTFEELLQIPTDSVELQLAFDSPAVRTVAVLEILEMAYADGAFHPTEQEVLRDFARALGVSAAELDGLADLVKRRIDAEEAHGGAR